MTTATTKESTVAKRPAMKADQVLGLGDWEDVDEVPIPMRSFGGQRLPMDFDAALARHTQTKKPVGKLVPVDFWAGWGITKENNTPAKARDRIRRSFYNWQGDKKDRQKFALAISDNYDAKIKSQFIGSMVYFQPKP